VNEKLYRFSLKIYSNWWCLSCVTIMSNCKRLIFNIVRMTRPELLLMLKLRSANIMLFARHEQSGKKRSNICFLNSEKDMSISKFFICDPPPFLAGTKRCVPFKVPYLWPSSFSGRHKKMCPFQSPLFVTLRIFWQAQKDVSLSKSLICDPPPFLAGTTV
jgi:hypothetical protein